MVSRVLTDLKAKQKMKEVHKYFMAGTDEEVLMGDVINVELEKDFGDGRTLKRKIEFKLTEETLPEALEMGIIAGEEEEEKDLIDFECELVSKADFQEFTKCVAEDIEDIKDTLNAQLKRLEALEKKNASSKKK